MSAARIDHAARALALITPAGALGTIDSTNEKRIAAAQVHATLALVEQQRIASIIAMVALPAVHAESLDRYPGVKDQILEALGLS